MSEVKMDKQNIITESTHSEHKLVIALAISATETRRLSQSIEPLRRKIQTLSSKVADLTIELEETQEELRTSQSMYSRLCSSAATVANYVSNLRTMDLWRDWFWCYFVGGMMDA
jgi:chromosome segregation ATPase